MDSLARPVLGCLIKKHSLFHQVSEDRIASQYLRATYHLALGLRNKLNPQSCAHIQAVFDRFDCAKASNLFGGGVTPPYHS